MTMTPTALLTNLGDVTQNDRRMNDRISLLKKNTITCGFSAPETKLVSWYPAEDIIQLFFCLGILLEGVSNE